jgi:hypothetical protein
MPDQLNRVIQIEVREALHTLWTKHVDLEGYDKKQWIRLEQAVERLIRHMKEREETRQHHRMRLF